MSVLSIPGKVFIKNLLARGVIGVNEWEKKTLQDILINVEVTLDLTEACLKDDIKKTADYKVITKAILKLIEKKRFETVEALGWALIKLIQKKAPRASHLKIVVEKPGAVHFAQSVGIVLEVNLKDFPK